MLDLRLPSGLFFSITGLLLAVVGLVSNPQAPMTQSNVDLASGVVMLVFGAFLLLLALRSRKA